MNNQANHILISEQKENVAYLTLNRPAVLNVLNKPLLLKIKKWHNDKVRSVGDDGDINHYR